MHTHIYSSPDPKSKVIHQLMGADPPQKYKEPAVITLLSS